MKLLLSMSIVLKDKTLTATKLITVPAIVQGMTIYDPEFESLRVLKVESFEWNCRWKRMVAYLGKDESYSGSTSDDDARNIAKDYVGWRFHSETQTQTKSKTKVEQKKAYSFWRD